MWEALRGHGGSSYVWMWEWGAPILNSTQAPKALPPSPIILLLNSYVLLHLCRAFQYGLINCTECLLSCFWQGALSRRDWRPGF